MEKPKVLLVGEHPLGTTGNCGMMATILTDIDQSKFDVSCAVVGFPNNTSSILFKHFNVPIIPISRENDFWGGGPITDIVNRGKLDILCFVGIDLWRYATMFDHIRMQRDARGFKWGAIFPYDFISVRDDFVEMANVLDFPCVYSQYGFDMLHSHVPNLRYFRPRLHFEEIWKPKTKEEIEKIRRYLFYGTDISIESFMIGFVGINQYRKDPQKTIKAFSYFSRKHENSIFYMHTEKTYGVYNIAQFAIDCGLETGKLLTKPDNVKYPVHQMPDVFNCFDLYSNCSIQEGLSWTVIESMLCGTPAVISDSTAHKELIVDKNLMVKCQTPCYLPIQTPQGQNWIDAFCCQPEDISRSFEWYYNLSEKDKEEIKQLSLKKGNEWIEGCHDPNALFREIIVKKKTVVRKEVKEAVLFAQHSAAGDVFMTTRCFKGLKERHPDIPFHYMTQEKYHGIIRNNPFIDKIIAWDPQIINQKLYKYIYNPHGDTILPGHWGRNCNSILSDFYWKILRVEPSDFYIEQIPPSIENLIKAETKLYNSLNEWIEAFEAYPVAVVHTTGGDPHFRTYKYMHEVSEHLRNMGFHVIQLGGKNDYTAKADTDFRGILSYGESAWIMSRARIAITVDSFMSHLAGALGIDQVCLFGSGNYVVVRPWQKEGSRLICMVPDYVYDCKGLGPCSASVKDCAVPCTGRHDPKDINKAVDQLLLSGAKDEVTIMREEIA